MFSILRLVAVFSFSLDAILVSVRLYKEKKQSPDSTGRNILNDSSEEECLRHEEHEDDTDSVEKLPIVYKILWILCNINSSLSVLITIGRSQRLYNKDLSLNTKLHEKALFLLSAIKREFLIVHFDINLESEINLCQNEKL